MMKSTFPISRQPFCWSHDGVCFLSNLDTSIGDIV